MSVVNAVPLLAAAGGDYQISRSVRLRSSASAYLNRTPAGVGNRQKFTISVWYKAGGISSGAVNANIINAGGDGSSLLISGTGAFGATYVDRLLFREAGTTLFYWPMVFRDPSAWYHIVFAMDTTQATAANRAKLYVNGVDQGAFSGTAITQNTSTSINNTSAHYINTFNGTNYPSDVYYTEYNLIDGQALTASSFGETDAVTGVWKPKKYAGAYGTNGFYLNFSDNSAATAAAIGKDYSGNGNNWTPNNISVTSGATYDSMLDTPTPYADGGNGRGNYAVLNPLNAGMASTITQGNLTFQGISSANQGYALSTIGVESGSFYFEVQPSSFTGVFEVYISNGSTVTAGYRSDGSKDIDGANSSYGASWTSSNTIGCAYNAGTKSVTFYKDNTSQGTFTYTGSGPVYAGVVVRGTASANGYVNFGQRPFAYTPPTGFKALNTQNLPDSTIKKGNAYFDATTYTGNASTNNIVNSGAMQPDLVWIKNRGGAFAHYLTDAVRGAYQVLYSNLTNAEYNGTSNSDSVSSFNSNGFTVLGGVNRDNYNQSSNSYVAWQWKESASAGFDIVTYTGTGSSSTVVNHSLGVKPKMIITKIRSSGSVGWVTTHQSLGTNMSDYYIYLNTTAASAFSSGVWGAEPTSTTFGSSVNIHSSTVGATVVAYLFAEVAGFSKFGSYTGNASTDGPFVFCGFKPRYILIKGSSIASSWYIFDTARSTYNEDIIALNADSSGNEATALTSYGIDILSNGFKIKQPTGYGLNNSGQTYIFMALAENPFKNSLAR